MDKKLQNFLLVTILFILLLGLALELMYIENMLKMAVLSKEEQCSLICEQKNKIPYVVRNSCFCKEPIEFKKRVRCFWNVTFDENEEFSSKFDVDSIRNVAVSSVIKYPLTTEPATRIFSIFNEVANRIYYVPDPYRNEYIAKPEETWEARGGDCDDISILLASMYEAVGLDAYLVEVYNKKNGHIFVIVKVDQDLKSFLKVYKMILEKYTPYYGKKPFHFYIFVDKKETCEKVTRDIENGGNVGSFFMVVDSTSKDYPGSKDPAINYEKINFIKIGES